MPSFGMQGLRGTYYEYSCAVFLHTFQFHLQFDIRPVAVHSTQEACSLFPLPELITEI